MTKKWFVMYSVRNPRTGKMQLFKVYAPLGKFHDPKSRTAAADKLITDLTDKLRHGWTPWEDDTKVIYDDRLEYQNITRIYGTRRALNRTIRYYASQYLEEISGRLDPDGTADILILERRTHRTRQRSLGCNKRNHGPIFSLAYRRSAPVG